jgi:outer membrane protein
MKFAPGLAMYALTAAAQSPPLALDQAVAQAAQNYGAVRVSAEQANAAAASINLARTAFLPKVDGIAQLNRGTRNNVYGMLMPNNVIMPISGPPNPSNSLTNVWGSAVGFLVAWEPFDFGLRQSQVDVASAARRRADVTVERTRFEVSAAAADAFLTILAAQQTVEAAKAGVARARTFHEVVSALVNAELRPGAESSRTRAELAMADTQRLQAEQAVAMSKAALSQYLGAVPAAVDPGKLLEAPQEAPANAATDHPAVREQTAVMQESQARMRVLDRSYFPKFNFQTGLYARGTGARPDFTTGGAASGLGPNIHNWGAGFSVTLPVMDYAALREKKAIESAQARMESARLVQIRQDLDARIARAQAMLDGARQILANLPVQLESARAAESQATARYRAGLGGITDVAEAQRLLTQTEIDHSLAKLQVWRAHLAVAAARGDIAGFLEMVKR